MDLQDNQAQVGKNMEVEMKNYMNLKYLMSLIKCIRETLNLNKCLENIQIDILLKRNARLFRLIKRAEVFKVQLISLMTMKNQKTKVMIHKTKTHTMILKLKESKAVTLQTNTIDKAMLLEAQMTKKKSTLIQRIQKT